MINKDTKMGLQEYKDGVASIREIFEEFPNVSNSYWESEYTRCANERLYWLKMSDYAMSDWYEGRVDAIISILKRDVFVL